jgi:hypothetical protein
MTTALLHSSPRMASKRFLRLDLVLLAGLLGLMTGAGSMVQAQSTNLFNINTSATNGTGGFIGATGIFSLSMDGNNDLFLNYAGAGAPIPELGTWVAAAILVLGVGCKQWRRRLRESRCKSHSPAECS